MTRRLMKKWNLAARRASRVRSRVIGTPERPRLSVNVSNMHITAQLIDDHSGKTLAYVSSVGRKEAGNMSEKAIWVGNELAKKAVKAGISAVSFDRGSKKFHGRLSALANAAREGGLRF